MIDSAEVENYQSHKRTVLEFSPGVNIIKGDSHGGKSALFRALKWALRNTRGFGFKSYFSKPKQLTICAIAFDDSSWVSRERSATKNHYKYGTESDYNNDPLKAVRSDIPEEIQSITNMDERNLRGQGDGYFILNDSPGQAGKKLNNIIGLQIINDVISKANEVVNKAKARKVSCKEDIKETTDGIDKLQHVRTLKPLFDRIDKLSGLSKADYEKRVAISYIIESIDNSFGVIKQAQEWLDGVSPYFFKIQSIFKYKEKNKIQLVNIQSLIDKISWSKERIKQSKKVLGVEHMVVDLQSLIAKRANTRLKRVTIEKIYYDIQKSKQSILDTRLNGERLDKRKAELEKQLDYCPKCGSHKKHWREV